MYNNVKILVLLSHFKQLLKSHLKKTNHKQEDSDFQQPRIPNTAVVNLVN